MPKPVVSVYLQLNNRPAVYVGKRAVDSSDDVSAVAQLLRDVADEWESHGQHALRASLILRHPSTSVPHQPGSDRL